MTTRVEIQWLRLKLVSFARKYHCFNKFIHQITNSLKTPIELNFILYVSSSQTQLWPGAYNHTISPALRQAKFYLPRQPLAPKQTTWKQMRVTLTSSKKGKIKKLAVRGGKLKILNAYFGTLVYFGKLNFTQFGARQSRRGLGLPSSTSAPSSTLAGAKFENEAPEKRYDYTLLLQPRLIQLHLGLQVCYMPF